MQTDRGRIKPQTPPPLHATRSVPIRVHPWWKNTTIHHHIQTMPVHLGASEVPPEPPHQIATIVPRSATAPHTPRPYATGHRPALVPRSSFLVPRSSHIQRTHFPDMAHIDAAGRAAKDLSACTSSRGKVLTARSSGHGEGVTPSRWQVWARLRVETRHS